MNNYSEKLKSPKWQKKRLEILQRDNFTCQICTDSETELHVHHKKYTGEPFEAPAEDLITLCKCCHKAETFANKNTMTVISAFKKGGDYFAKLSNNSLYILKSSINFSDDSITEIEMQVMNPKELAVIINTMF